jgi:hypothetical protein
LLIALVEFLNQALFSSSEALANWSAWLLNSGFFNKDELGTDETHDD